MLPSTHKELLAQFIERVWNHEELAAIPEYIAPSYAIFHDPGDPWEGQVLDRAGFAQRLTQPRAAAPDQKFAIQDLIGQDNKVVAAWKWRGTHLGEIAGIPATGRVITMSGLTVYTFTDLKLAGHWQVTDRLSIYRQLAG